MRKSNHKPATSPINTAPRLLKVPEAAALLSVGRNKIYELIKAGRIKTVEIDGMKRVRMSALQEYVDSL